MSVLTNLRTATKGLLFLSESDAPLKPFVWKGITIDSAEALLAHLERPATTSVTVLSLTEFFAPMTTPQSWHDDDAKADVARFTALLAQLATLENPRVYRLGTGPEIPVYVIGKVADGDTVGLSTQLTET